MINKAVNRIVDDFHKSPLKATDQLVLIGYSYGSVLQSHVTLKLHRMGYRVTMLILVGSPVSTNSQLYQALTKVTHIERIDIPGDKLSNPTSPWQYFEGGGQNSSDDGPHFDLARPGATADRKIKETARKIENLLNRHGR
jgi:pimeloyl-ACP methyl ester carboxylesterase